MPVTHEKLMARLPKERQTRIKARATELRNEVEGLKALRKLAERSQRGKPLASQQAQHRPLLELARKYPGTSHRHDLSPRSCHSISLSHSRGAVHCTCPGNSSVIPKIAAFLRHINTIAPASFGVRCAGQSITPMHRSGVWA